jgi:hypothetical protein
VVLCAGNVGIFRGTVVRDCDTNAHCVAIAKPVADTKAQSDTDAKPDSVAVAQSVDEPDSHSFGHANPRVTNRGGREYRDSEWSQFDQHRNA